MAKSIIVKGLSQKERELVRRFSFVGGLGNPENYEADGLVWKFDGGIAGRSRGQVVWVEINLFINDLKAATGHEGIACELAERVKFVGFSGERFSDVSIDKSIEKITFYYKEQGTERQTRYARKYKQDRKGVYIFTMDGVKYRVVED